ncbi:MAG: phasin family protein, partial [Methylococcaceae bacterium]|nr:phasin family protein [Methylococcaceae bacterium]
FKQLSDVSTRAYANMVKGQTEIADLYVRTGVKQMELVRDLKDIPGYWKAQKELTVELSEELIQCGRSSVEIAATSRDDLFGWIESNIQSAAKLSPLAEAKAA